MPEAGEGPMTQAGGLATDIAPGPKSASVGGLFFRRALSRQRPVATDVGNKLLTMLLSPDDGQSEHCVWRVVQWDAYRLTPRFPVRRAAVSLDGWSARRLEMSSEIWF
jgi:hypothetical protein